MASSKLLVIFAVVALAFPSLTIATEYWVGDSQGWTVNYDYDAWASDKMFMVGDTLVFNYTQGSHNVMKVNGTAFESCMKSPSNALSSGLDRITLLTSGKKWYICGVADHCAQRMQKLKITVMDMMPAPSPSSAFSLVKSGYQALLGGFAGFSFFFVAV